MATQAPVGVRRVARMAILHLTTFAKFVSHKSETSIAPCAICFVVTAEARREVTDSIGFVRVAQLVIRTADAAWQV